MKKRMIIIIALLCLAGTLTWMTIGRNRSPEISHIILISMDTTRADHFSCYGYPRNTTPNIDAFADEATRYENVISPVPITLPAHSSMLTGMIPPAHGVHNNIGYKLAASNITLPEMLQENGFHTTGVISAFVLDRKMGMAQGFDDYQDTFKKKHRNRFGNERRGDETTEVALDWLDKNKERKAFLFLHYYDPHVEYAPPEPFATEFKEDPYAGEIAFVDHCIGKLIDRLKQLDLYDSTLLIVTGDHGEMLGEHGESEHTYFIYESAIKVPLIMKFPGQTEALTVAEPVGLVDIVPTVCAQLGIDLPARIQGVDISLLQQGEVPADYERFIYSESMGPTRIGVSSLMSISTEQWKYIQAPRAELYDVVSDPEEKNNLLRKESQRARILEDKLRETLEDSVRQDLDSQIELDAESVRRLESLGYVAGKDEEGIVFDENQDDPKDFVQVFELFHKALHLRDGGDIAQAEKIIQGLVAQRPDFAELHVKLGDFAWIRQDYNQAILSYRRASELGLPLYPQIYNNLAWLQATRPMLASRNLDEAVAYAKKGCEATNYTEPSTLDTLAVAYAASGDFPKAVETADKAYKLAIVRKNTAKAQKISDRLKLFRQSKPYIEH